MSSALILCDSAELYGRHKELQLQAWFMVLKRGVDDNTVRTKTRPLRSDKRPIASCLITRWRNPVRQQSTSTLRKELHILRKMCVLSLAERLHFRKQELGSRPRQRVSTPYNARDK